MDFQHVSLGRIGPPELMITPPSPSLIAVENIDDEPSSPSPYHLAIPTPPPRRSRTSTDPAPLRPAMGLSTYQMLNSSRKRRNERPFTWSTNIRRQIHFACVRPFDFESTDAEILANGLEPETFLFDLSLFISAIITIYWMAEFLAKCR
ncbi:hypothetical protein BS50DRAFT_20863 [Corynespora cassiicola Philippines]|uniref:Uncharacterized protein n=1 Tax=Corynespora cassiicola Philippines TaxID=1448308 RepID=A0A2T2PAH0_CORCC|nr:hypothetical protein BS50DRAFT_20863 [Corynespora cassiicola Philippines]